MIKMYLRLLGAFFCFGLSLNGMDNPADEFARQLAEKFPGFATINPAVLKYAIENVPAQETIWGCGKHQCGHMQACAFNGTDLPKLAVDYSRPENYPLAVNATAGFINSLGFLSAFIPKDSEGNFRVGATPHEMAWYLNSCILPPDFAYKAEAFSEDILSAEILITLVIDSVDKNMPMLAYFVSDAQRMLMHVYALVGVNYAQEEVLMLDTHGQGLNRLKKMNAQEFVNAMNASTIINSVKFIDAMGASINLRSRISSSGGRVVSIEILNQWKPFSLVTCFKDR